MNAPHLHLALLNRSQFARISHAHTNHLVVMTAPAQRRKVTLPNHIVRHCNDAHDSRHVR